MIYIPQFCQMDKISQISKDKNANMVARGDEKILVRCSIVGDSMVGKTTTVAAFTEADHKEYSPTIFENYAGKRYVLTICPLGFFVFLSSADFFQNQLFRKFLSGIPSEFQTVWIQIKPDSVWPDLVPICLQKISADYTRR